MKIRTAFRRMMLWLGLASAPMVKPQKPITGIERLAGNQVLAPVAIFENPEYYPRKHSSFCYATQKRQAKKRNNIRKRNRK